MQQALPYRLWVSNPVDNRPESTYQNAAPSPAQESNKRELKNMVLENAVILFGKRGCCMCHAMKRLLLMLGVNPAVYEVDEGEEEKVINELMSMDQSGGSGDCRPQFPAMFIGGKLFGGLDRLMGAHISGELIPLLKQAGALWL